LRYPERGARSAFVGAPVAFRQIGPASAKLKVAHPPDDDVILHGGVAQHLLIAMMLGEGGWIVDRRAVEMCQLTPFEQR
jgi:hypothetical protein